MFAMPQVRRVPSLTMTGWCLVLSLSLCFLEPAGAAPPPSAAPEADRMTGIRTLGLAFLPGEMPTYYSDSAQPRARYLQGMLGGELSYYAGVFQVRLAPVTLAALNADQWPKVAGEEPYGMPSVEGGHPYVFVMPATWQGVTWMPFPRRAEVPPAILKEALAGRRSWQQVQFEGCDGIGTHEIGHTIIVQLGIDTKPRWFNEFLASYIGYAYLKAKHPRAGLSSEIFWTQRLEAPHPFTKLDDFETKYDELQEKYPANYGWFQLAFDQRVIEIYRDGGGIDFLRKVRSTFPRGGPALSSAQVLDKLEGLFPGWHAWAERVEAGTIEPVTLEPVPH